MRKAGAEITVFLSLICLLVFALLAVCLEGARVSAARYLLQQASASSLQSVFAGYQWEVLQDFGLLMCRGRENGEDILADQAAEYGRRYLNPGEGLALSAADGIGLRSLSVNVDDIAGITDQGGGVLGEAVLSYMKTGGISVLIQELLERMGLYDEEGAISFANTIQSFVTGDSFDLKEMIEDYKTLQKEAEDYQESLRIEAETAEGDIGGQNHGEAGAEKEQEEADNQEKLSGVNNLIEKIREIREKGILAFLTDDKSLSSQVWDLSGMPSAAAKQEPLQVSGDFDASPDEKFLWGEYLMHHMSRYGHSCDDCSAYEIEYILTGKGKDTECLQTVASWLLLLRSGLNLVCLLRSPAKLQETEAAAFGAAAALGAPWLAHTLQMLLLTIWAAAEAFADVRVLLKGGKTALFKTDETWRTQLFGSWTAGDSGNQTGLAYQDYLRLFLYIEDTQLMICRTMDVIQQRISSKGIDFQIGDYIIRAGITMEASIGSGYLAYAPFRRLTGIGDGWTLSRKAEFQY